MSSWIKREGYEGNIAQLYYRGINQLLDDDFKFTKRTRRPPKDPFNSLLSFGYTILLYEIYTACINKGLNPYVAFFHTDKHKHPALCSDLMEEWRPVLVDTLCLALVNRGTLTSEHFEHINQGAAVYLTKSGSKVFLAEFEKRMRQEVKYIQSVDHKMSFRRMLDYQAGQCIKALESGEPSIYSPIYIR